ncbi:protein kinase domain-containing protein [Streptomyces triticagri]|uniref:protein kinase domain-containing protein n=1 Tax=Streptomyces triticagri TaxID=2293568 RepID=UPI001F218654|nr:protein kinase [Streptomyces triticagri]
MVAGLVPGQQLDQGRYVVGELMGEGGMATVHRAWDSELDREVALKTMNAAVAVDASARERFRREARAIARLSHPMIVAVYDVREERLDGGAVPYIVMEYLDGRTLAQWAPRAAGLDEVLAVVSDVLSGLAASHARGMVHRDIKPANVMVCRDGSVKVMDFGIAHALDHQGSALTRTGFSVGTPHYMAPEQFESGRNLDGRTDLYAVGVLLFQLLTGDVPFDADSGFRIGYKHATMAPPKLADRGAELPEYVEELVATALAKSPDDRFADAGRMRAAVEDVRARLASSRALYSPTEPVDIGAGGVAASPQSPAGPAGGLHAEPTRTSAARHAEAAPAPAAAPRPAPQPAAWQPPARRASAAQLFPRSLRPGVPVDSLQERKTLLGFSFLLMVVVAVVLAPMLGGASSGSTTVLGLLLGAVSAYGVWLSRKGGLWRRFEGDRSWHFLWMHPAALFLTMAHVSLLIASVGMVFGIR